MQNAGSFTNPDQTYYAEWMIQNDEISVTFRGKTRTGKICHDSYLLNMI